MGNEDIKLSDDLEYWRAERPDEWIMDRFIRKAKELEQIQSDLHKLAEKWPESIPTDEIEALLLHTQGRE